MGYSDKLKSRQLFSFYVVIVFPENKREKRLKNADHVQGNVTYAYSTGDNNGIYGFIESN